MPSRPLDVLVRQAAESRPGVHAITFLSEAPGESIAVTRLELDRRARAVAAFLRSSGMAGRNVLLLYPPGIDFVVALLGCFYSGVVAVPCSPPDPRRLAKSAARLQAVVDDAGIACALTSSAFLSLKSFVVEHAESLDKIEWIATDLVDASWADSWTDAGNAPDSEAILQYTSGSTSVPKGIVLTHSNVVANCIAIQNGFGLEFGYGPGPHVFWLPMFHDMGLIAGVIRGLVMRNEMVLMSPLDFLKKPIRWLRAIMDHRASGTATPNFALDLCVRRTTEEERAGLDLSLLSSVVIGSDPVSARTLDRFVETFGRYGFRREALCPAYGLAESTVAVTGSRSGVSPVTVTLSADALEARVVDRVQPGSIEARDHVGCGPPLAGYEVLIVDPVSRCPIDGPAVGEIWVAGPSVARGYWQNAEATQETFGAALVDGGSGPMLRTGDLGFLLDGELFVTSRIKDLIILHGRNIAPGDIESSIAASFAEVRPGCGAAFSLIDEESERLVVVFSIRGDRAKGANGLADRISDHVASEFGLVPAAVMLVTLASLPTTTSGKIQRGACRQRFREGGFEVLGVARSLARRRRLRVAAPPEGGRSEPIAPVEVAGK